MESDLCTVYVDAYGVHINSKFLESNICFASAVTLHPFIPAHNVHMHPSSSTSQSLREWDAALQLMQPDQRLALHAMSSVTVGCDDAVVNGEGIAVAGGYIHGFLLPHMKQMPSGRWYLESHTHRQLIQVKNVPMIVVSHIQHVSYINNRAYHAHTKTS